MSSRGPEEFARPNGVPADAPAPPGTWDELARSAGSRAERDEDFHLLRELLMIWIDGAPYALPVERVREIVRLRPITPMPRVPACVRGVISLRGEIVQVIDLRVRLGLPAQDGRSERELRRARIVVLHGADGQMTGLLVDRVSEVLRVTEDALRPVGGESDTVSALCARGSDFVSLFDVDRVLDLGAEG